MMMNYHPTEINIAIVLVIALITLKIMDQYSTETLLNLKKLWHENSDYREKREELELQKNPLNAEKNLWIRWLVKRYGIHKGLTYTSWISGIAFGYLCAAIIYNVTGEHWTIGNLVVWVMAIFFMLGIIFKQFLEAIIERMRWKKIRYG